jgi:hypothetical protein
MATKKAASKKPAAKKAAPKKKEPTTVESVSVRVDDAHVVLDLDGSEFRLDGTAVAQLRRDFEAAHSVVNPGH